MSPEVNDAPLNETHFDLGINVLDVSAINPKGENRNCISAGISWCPISPVGDAPQATLAEDMDRAFFTLKPDRDCEVLSPATNHIDQNKKRAIYARESVSYLWLVGPDTKTLEMFKLHKGKWLLLDTLTGDDPVSQPPFEAISFSLDALWPDGNLS